MRNTLMHYFSSTGLNPLRLKDNLLFYLTDTTLKLVPHPIVRAMKGSYDPVIYWIVILVTNVHFLAVLTTIKINTTAGVLHVSALWWEIM
jgi:hypothetical protein